MPMFVLSFILNVITIACMTDIVPDEICYSFALGPNSLSPLVDDIKKRESLKFKMSDHLRLSRLLFLIKFPSTLPLDRTLYLIVYEITSNIKIQNGDSPTTFTCLTTFVRYKISYNFVFRPKSLTLIVLEIKIKIQNGDSPTIAACTIPFVPQKLCIWTELSISSDIKMSNSKWRLSQIFFVTKFLIARLQKVNFQSERINNFGISNNFVCDINLLSVIRIVILELLRK